MPGPAYELNLRAVGNVLLLLQVEVACFEDVLTSMDRDITGKWSQLMFVPPGAMSSSKQ